jgi:hypothetical protein
MKTVLILIVCILFMSFAAHAEDQGTRHFREVIQKWSPASDLDIDSYLSKIWHVSQTKKSLKNHSYELEGISSLLSLLKQDTLFGSCKELAGISPSEMVCQAGYMNDGRRVTACGDIMTLRQLYIRLMPCGTNPAGN